MVAIVFDHPADDFPDLKIAGEFTNWEGMPMEINDDSGKWEYTFDQSSTTRHGDKVHFKFIDHNGNWFADDEYPKEIDEHSNENNVTKLENKEDDTNEEKENKEDDKGAKEEENNEQGLYDEGPETPNPSLRNLKTTISSNSGRSLSEPVPAEEAVTKEGNHDDIVLDDAPVNSQIKNNDHPTQLPRVETHKRNEELDNFSEGNDNTRVNEDTDVTDSQGSEHEIVDSDTENTDISEQEEIQKRDKPGDQKAKSVVKEGDTHPEDYESILEKLLGALGRFFGSWFSWLTTKTSGTETA